MFCPMPIVKLKKATKEMQGGQVLRLVTTDPGSKRDVPAWAEKTGNEILYSERERQGVHVHNQGELDDGETN
jgi:tRNA 2-thiouridine synthesizing protein A